MNTPDDNQDNSEINIYPEDVDIRFFSEEQEGHPLYISCNIEGVAYKLGTLSLPADVYLAKLALVIAHSLRQPMYYHYVIHHKETGRFLRASETLSSADVQAGDTLRLVPTLVGAFGGAYFRDMQFIDAVLTNRLNVGNPILTGMLFYSEKDKNIIEHVRGQMWQTLTFLHNPKDWGASSIFLVEEPCPELKPSLCTKMGLLYKTYADEVHIRLDWEAAPMHLNNWRETDGNNTKRFNPTSYQPYIFDKLIQVGEIFGIMSDQFPCLLLYEKMNSKSALVFDLNRILGSQSFLSNLFLFWGELRANILIEDEWENTHPLDDIQKEMTKSMTKCELSQGAIRKLEMNKSIIEAIAGIIDLLG